MYYKPATGINDTDQPDGVSTVSHNGYLVNMGQSITCINDEPVNWCIYALPGLNKLTHLPLDKMAVILADDTVSNAFLEWKL